MEYICKCNDTHTHIHRDISWAYTITENQPLGARDHCLNINFYFDKFYIFKWFYEEFNEHKLFFYRITALLYLLHNDTIGSH